MRRSANAQHRPQLLLSLGRRRLNSFLTAKISSRVSILNSSSNPFTNQCSTHLLNLTHMVVNQCYLTHRPPRQEIKISTISLQP